VNKFCFNFCSYDKWSQFYFVRYKEWESIVIALFLHMVRISRSIFMALSGNIWRRPSASQTSRYIGCGTLWKAWSNERRSVPYAPRVISDTSGRSWYHRQIHLVGGVQATGRWTTWKAAQKHGSPSECDSVNSAHNTKMLLYRRKSSVSSMISIGCMFCYASI
jgi:hypothetical protein